MKLIRVIISSACLLLASIVAIPAQAGSSDFSGPYIAISGAVNGGFLSGTYTDEDGSNTDASAGHPYGAVGGALGFNIAVGPVFFIGVEGSMEPGGGNIARADGSDASNGGDVDVTISDQETWAGIAGISLSEGSAFYFKIGSSDFDIECTAGNTCPTGLSGDTTAIGTISKFGHGLFVKTEAGVTDFDDIAITNLGDNDAGKITADPNAIYGKIQVGWQF